MAAVCGNAVSLQQVVIVKGGLGSLPEQSLRKRQPTCLSSSSSLPLKAGRWVVRKELEPLGSRSRRESLSVATKSMRDGRDGRNPEERSRVFESTQSPAERSTGADGRSDDVDVARAISDIEASWGNSTGRGGRAAVQPPRFATLRAFGEAGGDGVVTGEFSGTSVFELIAANIEASKQVKNWEVLSGRLAMLAISVALGMEIFTGNSVFRGIDLQKLEAVGALCAVASLSAGAFAFAWRAKSDVVNLMSKSYKTMVESALDSLIDGLFFDEA